MFCVFVFFFFQAEDGIRDAQESRGLGDVYKRQMFAGFIILPGAIPGAIFRSVDSLASLLQCFSDAFRHISVAQLGSDSDAFGVEVGVDLLAA